MSGEVTATSALLQTRLTESLKLDSADDLPGAAGFVRFEWSERKDFRDAHGTPLLSARQEHDFIVRAEVTGLRPGVRHYFRALYGTVKDALAPGPTVPSRLCRARAGLPKSASSLAAA